MGMMTGDNGTAGVDGVDGVAGGLADGGVRGVAFRTVRIDVEGEDVLRAIPEGFLSAYLRLLPPSLSNGALSAADVGRAQGRRVTRVSSGQTETRGGARTTRAGLSERSMIVDERLWLLREKTNRKLRAIGRDLVAVLDGTARSSSVRSGVRRCTRCRKWSEPDWSFCPYDGAPTEEMM